MRCVGGQYNEGDALGLGIESMDLGTDARRMIEIRFVLTRHATMQVQQLTYQRALASAAAAYEYHRSTA